MASQSRSSFDNKSMTALQPYPLLVGSASAVSSVDAIRRSGVKCLLNVTTDLAELQESDLGSDIEWHRLPLQDTEDQDITKVLDEAMSIIDRVAAAGGKTLVYCYEGRSRSVSVCLAHLITRDRMSLADALSFIKSRRPEVQPNAGFLRQLMALELSTLGSSSMQLRELPKGKPKCLTCEICGQSVGLKSALASHLKLKHNTDATTLATVGVCAVIENELTTLLQRVNPSKVANIPNLLQKYAGREQELLAQVTAKYGA